LETSRWPEPAGPRILIPGYPQFAWRQRERAAILFGSYVAAMSVAVFAWGTAAGLAVFGFAFVTHAFSAADAIRQFAFPAFGRMVPPVMASAGLGMVCYVPMLLTASVLAWPVTLEERPREGYLINRWAYRGEDPRTGETAWLSRHPRGARPRISRVIAGPGQRVELSAGVLRVDGRVVEESPFGVGGAPGELKLTVPREGVLVAYGSEPRVGQPAPGGWEIVDLSEVEGRAWARSYPFWERKLLPTPRSR
jgi:signal peptidase I